MLVASNIVAHVIYLILHSVLLFYIVLCAYYHIETNWVDQMPKNYYLKELILESLSENELSKKEILERVKSSSNVGASDKTFNESLMTLLQEGKIYIAGYDFNVYSGVKRIQSIRSEGIIFGLSRMDFVEIETLLKQMESENLEESNRASSSLKRIFRRKLTDVQQQGKMNFSNTSDVLFERTIYHLNSQDEESRRSFRNKFAWGLSNNQGSLELFENILSYLVSQESG